MQLILIKFDLLWQVWKKKRNQVTCVCLDWTLVVSLYANEGLTRYVLHIYILFSCISFVFILMRCLYFSILSFFLLVNVPELARKIYLQLSTILLMGFYVSAWFCGGLGLSTFLYIYTNILILQQVVQMPGGTWPSFKWPNHGNICLSLRWTQAQSKIK